LNGNDSGLTVADRDFNAMQKKRSFAKPRQDLDACSWCSRRPWNVRPKANDTGCFWRLTLAAATLAGLVTLCGCGPV